MTGIVQELCRSYGDRVGRERMRQDTTLRPGHAPKGNALLTGETLPDIGESGLARLLIIEFERGELNWDVITDVQEKQGRLSECMREFITWLSIKGEGLRSQLKKQFLKHRKEAFNLGHGRTAEQLAHLMVSVEVGLLFFLEQKIITEDRAKEICSDAWKVFISLGEIQTRSVKKSDPCTVFISTLKTLIQTKAIYFQTDRTQPLSRSYGGYEVTDEDTGEEYYYLVYDKCFGEVNKFLQPQGLRIPVDSRTLRKRLIEAGHVVVDNEGNNPLKRFQGMSRNGVRLLCLKKCAVEEAE